MMRGFCPRGFCPTFGINRRRGNVRNVKRKSERFACIPADLGSLFSSSCFPVVRDQVDLGSVTGVNPVILFFLFFYCIFSLSTVSFSLYLFSVPISSFNFFFKSLHLSFEICHHSNGIKLH